MSRLILKNLPKKIKEEKLKQLFGSKGEITDFKLCYSKSGTFRRFGFIGFKTESEAQSALKHFNNTYINTSKIQVEIAKSLGDDTVPRPWSKHSEQSSAFGRKQKTDDERRLRIQKLQEDSNNDLGTDKMRTNIQKLRAKNKKQKAIEFLKSMYGVENDSGFQEFLEAHQTKSGKQTWTDETSSIRLKLKEEHKETEDSKSTASEKSISPPLTKDNDHFGVTYEEESENSDDEYQDIDDENQHEETALTDESNAHQRSSDLDWLKYKTKLKNQTSAEEMEENIYQDHSKKRKDTRNTTSDKSECESDSSDSDSDTSSVASDKDRPIPDKETFSCLTVKMRGIPFKSKEKDIVDFFSPLKLSDIRIPLNEENRPTGNAYVDFTTESDVRKALKRNKHLMKKRYIELFREKSESAPLRLKETGIIQTEFKSKKDFGAEEDEEPIAESGRLFLRNLSYTCNEEEIQKYFEKFGPLAEVNLPTDKQTKKTMGFGFVTYLMPEHAVKAFNKLDGQVFQGRLLHILPGRTKKSTSENQRTPGELSFKKTKEAKQKALSSNEHNWNALFLGLNAVADVMAEKMNSTKSGILDAEKADSLAVRMALGETEVVAETREFLVSNGVKLDVFGQPTVKRSTTVMLVKNLPHGTQPRELNDTFGKYGELSRVLIPPAGITAIIEFLQPNEAREAFRNLAYSKFKHVPLFLEWAPVDIFSGQQIDSEERNIDNEENEGKHENSDNEDDPEEGCVLFVKNLNFDTSEDTVREDGKIEGQGPVKRAKAFMQAVQTNALPTALNCEPIKTKENTQANVIKGTNETQRSDHSTEN